MTRLKLIVRPDGRAILTAPERLTDTQRAMLLAELRGWDEGQYGIAIVDGCDVVTVSELEIDLGEPAEPVAV